MSKNMPTNARLGAIPLKLIERIIKYEPQKNSYNEIKNEDFRLYLEKENENKACVFVEFKEEKERRLLLKINNDIGENDLEKIKEEAQKDNTTLINFIYKSIKKSIYFKSKIKEFYKIISYFAKKEDKNYSNEIGTNYHIEMNNEDSHDTTLYFHKNYNYNKHIPVSESSELYQVYKIYHNYLKENIKYHWVVTNIHNNKIFFTTNTLEEMIEVSLTQDDINQSFHEMIEIQKNYKNFKF